MGQHTWDSTAIPDDGNTYQPAFYQWNAGVNNEAGGVVSFAGAGGSGMAQTDVDATTYTPSVGDDLSEPGHASGADGRAYQKPDSSQNLPRTLWS